jgi:hypothetical protein
MKFMKAIQVSAPGGDFELVQREIPEPTEGQVRIKFVMGTILLSREELILVLHIRVFLDMKLSEL